MDSKSIQLKFVHIRADLVKVSVHLAESLAGTETQHKNWAQVDISSCKKDMLAMQYLVFVIGLYIQ